MYIYIYTSPFLSLLTESISVCFCLKRDTAHMKRAKPWRFINSASLTQRTRIAITTDSSNEKLLGVPFHFYMKHVFFMCASRWPSRQQPPTILPISSQRWQIILTVNICHTRKTTAVKLALKLAKILLYSQCQLQYCHFFLQAHDPSSEMMRKRLQKACRKVRCCIGLIS